MSNKIIGRAPNQLVVNGFLRDSAYIDSQYLPVSIPVKEELDNLSDAINSVISAATVVVATNATVTLTSNQAVYAVNTSSAPVTLTLPASPAAGARVIIIDYANTFQTNACTVARNGKNIEGAASNLSLHLRGQSVTLLFIDNTVGWKIIAQSKQGGFV